MTMFQFSSMKQIFSELFPKKAKKENRQSRHLVIDPLETRELLTASSADAISSTSYYVNELPIYESNTSLIEQIQNLKDNNYSIDYDMGGDEDGDLVVVWERPDVVYTTKEGETEQYEALVDKTTLSPTLDWNIYARYLTNETQRLYLDPETYDPTKLEVNTYNTIGLFYGQMQDLDPDGEVTDDTVDTKIASGLVYKISFTSEAQPLTDTQESINARFSIYAYDKSGKSEVSTFTFQEQYDSVLSIDGEEGDVLDYTESMERNAADLQAKLRGLGQTQGKYLNDCVVKAISPTEYYVYVYSDEIKATWDEGSSKWTYDGVPSLAIYQENPEGEDNAGFEVSANIEVISSPTLYKNIKVDPTDPLQTASNIQNSFNAKLNTNLMAPISTAAPDRLSSQKTLKEGPATETDMVISGGIYPEVLVVPVYGLTDADGNSLDGYVYDITFVGESSYINHPLLTGLCSDGTTEGINIVTIKESSSEFRVNDPESEDDPEELYDQLNPAVAMDADGDFVITWQSEVSDTKVRGSYVDIYAKSYSARSYINDYSYLSNPSEDWPTDMMVNSIDTYTYIEGDTAADSYYKKNTKNVYVQSVVCTSDQFRVNTSTANAQRDPDIAMDLDGNYVIAWDSEGQTISYFNGIYMQRFTKDNKAIGKETRVDNEVTGSSTNPSVAANDDGQFVVAWEYTIDPLVDIGYPYYSFYNQYFSYYYESDFYYMSEIHAAVFSEMYPSEGDFQTLVGEFVVGDTKIDYADYFDPDTHKGSKDPTVAWSDCGDYIIGWTALEGDTDSTGLYSSGVYAVQYRLEKDETGTDTEADDETADDETDDTTDETTDETEETTVTTGYKNTLSQEQYRVNSGSLNGTETTYWDYSQLVGEVGMDADGDVIVTYSGYGPDTSVNSIIPYISGASLSTSGVSYKVFLDNMRELLKSQSAILQEKYPGEEYANLLNFFNPTGDTGKSNIGDKFTTETKNRVEEDGTLVKFTSVAMQELVAELQAKELAEAGLEDGFTFDYDITGVYECHGDVDSVIAMVITNAQMMFRLDALRDNPQFSKLNPTTGEYEPLDTETQEIILGALASVLESQFGLLRGDASGVMYTQIDAGTADGNDKSMIVTSDSVANDQRDGVNAVADISLDTAWNRIWDEVVVTVTNKASDTTADVTIAPVYDDLGDNLYRLNKEETAEAIEAALQAAVDENGSLVLGTSWSDSRTNFEKDYFEGPVEVRAISWDEIQKRGLVHIGDDDSQYSNSAMDFELFATWFTNFSDEIALELGITNFADFTFEDLLAFINNEDLTEEERQERIDNLPVIFEIVFQGGVHDLEIELAWRNSTIRYAEQQLMTINPDQTGTLWYAISVNGEPDEFTNPSQLLSFDCTDEASVDASLDRLRAYLEDLGYTSAEVELVSCPTDPDTGETIYGVGEYQIRVTFPGNVGEQVTLQFYNTFVLPPLTEQGGYDPANYPWLTSGRFNEIQRGTTSNRVHFGTSMYYYGDMGTPQTQSTINVTPDGDFQIGYLQNELYNSRTVSNTKTSSTYNSYSNTNVMIRAFEDTTDTAGAKVSGINIDGKRIQQGGQISDDDINYVIVYFNEEMMYYNRNTKASNSEAADWESSVVNPDNWLLVKDGVTVTNGITDIVYGMNISQYLYDAEGNPLSEYGSNKWEAVIYFDGPLDNGSYELIARDKIEDISGNALNRNGANPDGADATFDFNVVAFEDPNRVNDDIAFVEGEQYFERDVKNGQSMLVWSSESTGMDGNGDTVTVWVSETTADDGTKQQEICYRIDYVGSDTDGTGNLTLKSDYYTIYSSPMEVPDGMEDILAHAAVGVADDGDFIISWSEYSADTGWDVYARRFNLNGIAKDGLEQSAVDANHKQFIVNSTVDGDQMYSSVAISALGDYAIAWQSKLSEDEDRYADWDIYVAQFYADGTSKVDEPETQEITFSERIYNGSFKLEYSADQTKYPGDIRYSDVITVNGDAGTIMYGNLVVGTNTPESMALAMSYALEDMGIVAEVEPTNYTLYTIEIKTLDGEPVSGDFEELAVKPIDNLKAIDGTAIYSSVNTKYNADSGEILVNESYLLEPGQVEQQTVSFGKGEFFQNLQNFKISFSYTDYEGYTHNCTTSDSVVFRDADDDEEVKDGETEITDEMLEEIIDALDSIYDQDGIKISIEDDAHELSTDNLAVNTKTNTITITFAGDVAGYNVSNLTITNINRIDNNIETDIEVTEKVQGTMGGFNADVSTHDIYLNKEDYYDLQDNDQMFPSIAMDAQGNFVVTWTSFGDVNYDEKATEANVYARTFDSKGNTITCGLVNTNEVETTTDDDGNTTTTIVADNQTGIQKWSSVAMSRNGEFVVTWTSIVGKNADVYAKRYTFLQAYYSGEAAASTLDPNVEAEELEDGETSSLYYTEAYSVNENGYLLDYKGNPVFFHSDGATTNPVVENYADIEYKAMSPAFMVNTTAVGNQQYSKVSMDATGNFIITWESDDYSANQSEKIYKTYAQRYYSNYTLVEDDKINKHGNELIFGDTDTDDSDRFPTVAMNSNGDWVLAWTRVYDENSAYYSEDNKSDIYQVKNYEEPIDDETSPVITKFQAVSPVQQGDLFTYLLDSDGQYILDNLGNKVFVWKDTEQRYSVNDKNEINTVDTTGAITSETPLNNTDNPTYVYNPTTKTLDIYTAGKVDSKEVTVTEELPFDDFTSNGLLNYVFSVNEDGNNEYSYTDLTEESPYYLDVDSGKIYNPSVKMEDIQYLIDEDYSVDDNVVSVIVGFSEEMSTTGATSVLNPSNWEIYQEDIKGNKVPVAIKDIVMRDDSMFSEGESGKNEIVIYLEPSEEGLPSLASGYKYEFIGSTNMEDLNENPLDGTYSEWSIDGRNGVVGGTESDDFDKEFKIGEPTTLASGNVSENPDEFEAADLEGDTLVNSYNQEGVQENSAVATDIYGNYVVVWETDWIQEDETEDYQKDDLGRILDNNGVWQAENNDQSNGFRRIMAQVYDYDGNRVGSEFVVCLEEYTHQCSPDVAMDDYGNFVITWVELSDTTKNSVEDSTKGETENVELDPYEDGTNIMAVRFTLDYDDDHYAESYYQVGDVFQVDNDVRGAKTSPSVAIDSTTGNFVIAWCNTDYKTTDSIMMDDNYYADGVVDRVGIYARIYSFSSSYDEPTPTAAATGLGAVGLDAYKPFLVNSTSADMQKTPSVAMENGNLMVTWCSSSAVDYIEARAFNVSNAGIITKAYDQQVVNQDSTYKKSLPNIDMDTTGNAVIVWESMNQDGSVSGVYGRTYHTDAYGVQSMQSTLTQDEFRVNTTTFSNQTTPVVALGDDGRCVISWVSFGQERSDYDASQASLYSKGVFAKWYNDVFTNAYLGTLKDDVQVNSLIYGSQFQQDVAMNRAGQSVFSWTGPGSLENNYVVIDSDDDDEDGGNTDGGEDGGEGVLTNTHDNILNGSTMAGVSNQVSTLDYSDIYRRRFLWTPESNVPSTLSPDFVVGEGATGQFTPASSGSLATYEMDSSDSKSTLTSLSDGTWTLVENNVDVTDQLNGAKALAVDGKGSSITLYGSSGADTVNFTTVERNGQKVDAATFTNSMGQEVILYNFASVNILGRGGSDSVTFDNTIQGSDSRSFTTKGSTATLTTKTGAYTYTVTDFAEINFNGVSGDSVSLNDTVGTDTVTVTDNAVYAVGADYSITAKNFSNLDMTSVQGLDALHLQLGTATELNLGGSDGSFETTTYKATYSGFSTVTSATNTDPTLPMGKADVSITITDPEAVVNMYSNKITYTQDGTSYTINSFANATVNVTEEAADCKVNIYDSTGNDKYIFNAADRVAVMNLSTGFTLTVAGSDDVNAFSKYGGTDTAEFQDSAKDDVVTMGPRYMGMTDSDGSYVTTATGFSINNAYSKNGADAVKMSDYNSLTTTDVKDDFYLDYTDSGVVAQMQSTAKNSYNNTATGFGTIVVESKSKAAIDTARIVDGEGEFAAMSYTASGDEINLVSSKANITVKGFRNTEVSTINNVEIAIKDTASDDTLVMLDGQASMSGLNYNDVAYTMSVTANKLYATSENGGKDTVTVITSSALTETIDSIQNGSNISLTVTDVDGSYRNKADNFKFTNVTKADSNDTASVTVTNSTYNTIEAYSYIDSFSYNQDGTKGRNLSITGAVKSLDMKVKEATGIRSDVNLYLHDSALEDELDITTGTHEAVINQVSTGKTRKFTGVDMTTVSDKSNDEDTKYVDDILTDWDDWSDTDTWIKGEDD